MVTLKPFPIAGVTPDIFVIAGLESTPDSVCFAFVPDSHVAGTSLSLATAWTTAGFFAVFGPAERTAQEWASAIATMRREHVKRRARIYWFASLTDGSVRYKVAASVNADGRVSAPIILLGQIQLLINGTDVKPGMSGLEFTGTADKQAKFGTQGSPPVKITKPVTLRLTVQDQAVFGFAIEVSERQLSTFETGCAYFTPDPANGYVDAHIFPVFKTGTSGTIGFEAAFDPVSSAGDAHRNSLTFALGQRIPSYFLSDLGSEVTLLPQPGAKLLFEDRPSLFSGGQPEPASQYYFAPAGRFELEFAASEQAHAALLAGHAATEVVALEGSARHTLEFVPGQDAYVASPPWSESILSGGAPPLSNGARTSWVRIKIGTGGSAAYYAQPDGAPLYGDPGGKSLAESPFANGVVLDAVPVAIGRYGAADGDPTSTPAAPIVPIGAVRSKARALEIEAQRLAVARVAEIRDPRFSMESTTVHATTPQGFITEVRDGNWQKLVLARTPAPQTPETSVPPTDADVHLSLTALDQELQAALMQSEVFLVISRLPGLGFENRITVAGWSFEIDVPTTTGAPTEPSGDLPVLILKFHTRSLRDLAGDRAAYRPKYNPHPQHTIAAVDAFIRGVDKKLADKDPLYEHVSNVLRDPNWNGILAINCNIDRGGSPLELQAIMDDLPDAFRAHHIGVQINNIEGTGDDWTRPTIKHSSVFGLLDYQTSKKEPGHPKQGGAPATKPDFKFQVRTLRALFRNSELAQFECKIAFTANTLFDADARLTNPPAGETEPNTIVLNGRYESRTDAAGNRIGAYSFTEEKEREFAIDASIITSITLNRFEFATLKSTLSAGKRTTVSRFLLRGRIGLQELNIDVLSFRALEFSDLGVIMTRSEGSNDFEFSPGSLRFDVAASNRRGNSLLEKLPLKLKFFLFAGRDISHTLDIFGSLGFTELALPGTTAGTQPRFAFGFDFDLGSMGALVSALKGLKCQIAIGWNGTKIIAGLRLPESSGPGRKEIGIQGILRLVIEKFAICATGKDDDRQYNALFGDASIEVLKQRFPPQGEKLNALIFAKAEQLDRVGWVASYNRPPSGGSRMFDFRAIVLGQRYAPKLTGPSVRQILDDLEKLDQTKTCEDVAKFSTAYNPNTGWLFGTRFMLNAMNGLTIDLLLKDPDLYGLRVDHNLPMLPTIDILYRKITDDLGVYSLDLGLPPAYRSFEAGAATIAIPNVGISVWTNGDFKFDLGYPEGFNFTRSFQVQILPFIGWGGIYIAKLSGRTSDLLDTHEGVVLQVGFALRVGIGKEIQKGIFKAGATVSVYGILEGAIGLPPKQPFNPAEVKDFAVRGQIGVIVAVVGKADFGVTSISVSLEFRVGYGFLLRVRSGKMLPAQVWAEAEVLIKVRWVIARFRIFGKRVVIAITLHFHAFFRLEYTIGGGNSAFLAHLAAGEVAWNPKYVHPAGKRPLPIYLTPEVSPVASESAAGGSGKPPSMILLCSVERSITAGEHEDAAVAATETPFDYMLQALMGWTVQCALGKGANPDILKRPITREEARTLEQRLAASRSLARAPTPLDYDAITQFLKTNFDVTFGCDPTVLETTVFSVFPIPKEAKVRFASPFAPPAPVDFSSLPVYTEDYQDAAHAYFRELDPPYKQLPDPTKPAPKRTRTMAEIVFQDYFEALVKLSVQEIITLLTRADEKQPGAALTLEEVFAAFRTGDDRGDLFGMIATAASRFFLNGARLPTDAAIARRNAGARTLALYRLTGQQLDMFPTSGIPGAWPAGQRYAITIDLQAATSWIKLAADTTVEMGDEGFAGLQAAVATPVDPTLLGPLFVAPYVKPTKKAFALSTHSDWSAGFPFSSAPFIWDRAEAPVVRMRTAASTPPINRRIYWLSEALRSELAHGGFTATLKTKKTDSSTPDWADTEIKSGRWATRVDVRLRRVPARGKTVGGPGPEYIANVYEVLGADERTRRLLNLLDNDTFEALHLLHLVPGKPAAAHGSPETSDAPDATLMSDALDIRSIAILKTNLSRETNPDSLMLCEGTPTTELVAATLEQPTQFLELIRQCSLVNSGGFFISYQTLAGTGLDPALFDGGPEATTPLVIIAPHKDMTTLRPVANSVVVSDLREVPDDARIPYVATERCAYETAVELGCIPIRAYRANPDGPRLKAGEAPPPTHDTTFNLLDYGITGDATYEEVAPDNVRPITPTEVNRDDPFPGERLPDSVINEDWRYDRTIPLLRVLKKKPANTDPKPFYGAIGKPIALSVGFRDVFGNRAAKQLPVVLKPLYFDRLIPIAEWAGVTAEWTPAGKDKMKVTLRWKPSQPLSPTATELAIETQEARELRLQRDAWRAEGAEATGEMFEIIHAQVSDANVRYVISSSLAGEYQLTATDRKKLVEFVADIKTRKPLLDPVEFAVPAPASGRTHTADEVWVSFAIERPEALVDTFTRGKYPAAHRISSAVPLPEVTKQFIGDFKAAFADVVLAYGAGKVGKQPLWMVRKASLDGCKPGKCIPGPSDPAFFFAPRPLSTKLISAKGCTVTKYDPVTKTAPTQTLDLVDIGPDALAREFFDFLEWFLSPDMLVAARKVGEGAGATLAEAIIQEKGNLALAFSQLTSRVLERHSTPSLGDRESARTVIEQRLRRDLRAAYDVDVVVQVPMKNAAGDAGERVPRLYGVVHAEPADPTKQRKPATSTAKVELRKCAPDNQGHPSVNVLVDALDEAFVQAKLRYVVSHLELPDGVALVGPIADDSYEQSTWLQLLDPLSIDLTPDGPLTIPIALREHPMPPTLVSHGSRPEPMPNTTKAAVQLREAPAWRYVFRYERERAAQDVVHAEVTYTRPTADGMAFRADSGRAQLELLTTVLYGFHASINDLRTDLAKLRDSGDASIGALRVFAAMVRGVSAALTAHTGFQVALMQVERDTESMTFVDDDGALPKVALIQPHLSKGGKIVRLDSKGEPLEPQTQLGSDAWLLREVELFGHSVLERASARASMFVRRNEFLGPNTTAAEKTAEEFIFETAPAQFPDRSTPLIDRAYDHIDMSTLLAAPAPLQDYLAAFGTALLGSAKLEISLQCRYGFPLYGTAVTKDTPLDHIGQAPVFLVPPTPHDVASFKRLALENIIAAWLRNRQPHPMAGLLFDCTVYTMNPSIGSKARLPILRLRRLWLPLSKVMVRILRGRESTATPAKRQRGKKGSTAKARRRKRQSRSASRPEIR